MALKFHPDKNPEAPEEARTNFQKVTKAYEILSDLDKKKLYDETGIANKICLILFLFFHHLN